MIKMLHQSHFIDVSTSCRILNVSRSGYYDWFHREPSQQLLRRDTLTTKIRLIHSNSRSTYGSPRVHKVLLREGTKCSENTVAKIMSLNKISAKLKKRYHVVTTHSSHALSVAGRLYQTTQTEVARPEQVWVGDITYIKTKEGFMYLSTVMDLYTRKIVGWSLQNHMKVDLVIDAFKQAWGRRLTPAPQLIYHSDRGSQYASCDFKEYLNKNNITPSMSRRGNCYDNATMESFFHTLKTELVYRTTFFTQAQAHREIFEYIEIWYNRQRLHSSLGYLSPLEYEQQHIAS